MDRTLYLHLFIGGVLAAFVLSLAEIVISPVEQMLGGPGTTIPGSGI